MRSKTASLHQKQPPPNVARSSLGSSFVLSSVLLLELSLFSSLLSLVVPALSSAGALSVRDEVLGVSAFSFSCSCFCARAAPARPRTAAIARVAARERGDI